MTILRGLLIINIMTIMTVIAGSATIEWPFCRTIPSITGISIVYGYDLLSPAKNLFRQMGGIEDLGRRFGVMNTIAGIGTLCGPPIGGLFAGSRLGFIAVGYFAGEDIVYPFYLTVNFISDALYSQICR
ncbi:hypothetical protein B0H14DRAFT_2387918 [Mycena olivaceomarginata]|nr:hypothetical protein B0H14DRAFT_2387918 [Mycena olivaceomarginata]